MYATEDEDESKSKTTVTADAPLREPGDELDEALNAIENFSERKLKSLLRPTILSRSNACLAPNSLMLTMSPLPILSC
ncbi:hypothetical protein HJC23_000280 [Cyclotella cryptica]|uniref:Uncharacterized protein n=1 Tax=Cyclotella cryptica TaxID=29204 RepID=A0ABD3QBI5_9STRA|eukprot:CCRYP_006846-RA/>CCRYP_006846-RA protein AED:0.42 eAED:0.53 QI:0/-1/0/1/-1/1/1/0/77